jgi:hypothetical protein
LLGIPSSKIKALSQGERGRGEGQTPSISTISWETINRISSNTKSDGKSHTKDLTPHPTLSPWERAPLLK